MDRAQAHASELGRVATGEWGFGANGRNVRRAGTMTAADIAMAFFPTPAMRVLAEQEAALESKRLREEQERSQFGGLTLAEANAEAARNAKPIDWDGIRVLLGQIGVGEP